MCVRAVARARVCVCVCVRVRWCVCACVCHAHIHWGAQNGVVNLLDVEEIRGTVNLKPEEVRAKKLQREQKELKKLPRPPPPAFPLLDCFEKQNAAAAAAKSQPEP